MTACQHDWRTDPHRVLTSLPPKYRVVCAVCGAVSSRGMGPLPKSLTSNDPRDWEPAA